jgi:hypothetical protein
MSGEQLRPSAARRGFDLLLHNAPHLDVLAVEWQRDGPWLLVTLGQRSEGDDVVAWARHRYAVFKRTGAVHGFLADGSVTDDPVLTLT